MASILCWLWCCWWLRYFISTLHFHLCQQEAGAHTYAVAFRALFVKNCPTESINVTGQVCREEGQSMFATEQGTVHFIAYEW